MESGSRDSLKRVRGFNLTELAVVLVLALVAAAFAVPNVARVMANVRLRGSASNLSGLFQRARDRKSTRLNSSHIQKSRMPSSA